MILSVCVARVAKDDFKHMLRVDMKNSGNQDHSINKVYHNIFRYTIIIYSL